MVYQMSEKNQILIALFSIVVLCAGKLFKDYLFRSGYIEGMQVTTETSTQLRRNAAGGENVGADLYLLVTLDKDLTATQTLQVSWTGNSSSDVTTSTTDRDYTATVVSGTTTSRLAHPGFANPIIFTPSATIKAGSKVKISVKGITIYPGSVSTSKLTFKITPENGESPEVRDFKILAPLASGDNQFVASPSATSIEIQDAITGINKRLASSGVTDAERENLLKARSALVTLLATTYGTVKEAGQVFDSDALYEAQRTAIDFIKKEKARAASNATALKDDNANKRRMAQVNTYYTRNYEANTEVMKNIIYISVVLIILAILRNKDMIPGSISTLGVIFVLTMGGIIIGKQVFDIIRRNDHDFDKYDWNFNEDELNRKQLLQQNADPANLSEMGMGMAPCYGPGCCDIGTAWDNSAKKCIPGTGGRVSGTAVWTSSTGSLAIRINTPGGLSKDTPADKVTITLPDGLFSGTPILSVGSPAEYTGTPAASGSFELTKSNTNISANAVTIITITGMTVSPSAYTLSKQIKVKTTKDINEVGISITDI
jgi:hypothetical protein